MLKDTSQPFRHRLLGNMNVMKKLFFILLLSLAIIVYIQEDTKFGYPWMYVIIVSYLLLFIMKYSIYEPNKNILIVYIRVFLLIVMPVLTCLVLYLHDGYAGKDFIGTIVGGLLGIIGGYLVVKLQLYYNDYKENIKRYEENEKVKIYILKFLENEIMINAHNMALHERSMLFTKEWDRLKYQLVGFHLSKEYDGLCTELIALYNMIDEYNNIVNNVTDKEKEGMAWYLKPDFIDSLKQQLNYVGSLIYNLQQPA